MSIRFAAPPHMLACRMDRARARALRPMPANDNRDPPSDAAMEAALWHFARHGMAAAQDARGRAEDAFRAGNTAAYESWLEICRALDRRIARELVNRTALPQ